MKMRWIFLVGGLMMGCNEDSVAKEDWQRALCQPGIRFPASIALEKADAPVQQKFGKACHSLLKLQGLTFKEAPAAYLCRSFLAQEGMENDDSLPKRNAVLAVFGQKSVDEADILTRQGFMGKEFAAVLLGNSVITQRSALSPLLVAIETSEAAAAWAQLTGHAGGEPGHRAFCEAKIVATDTGWRFDNVEAFRNCSAPELLSLTVNKTGKVTVLSREVKKNPDGTITATCVD